MEDQEQFGMAWAKIQDLVSSMYGRFLASDLPSETIVKELIDLDLKTILLKDFKLNGEINIITNNYSCYANLLLVDMLEKKFTK